MNRLFKALSCMGTRDMVIVVDELAKLSDNKGLGVTIVESDETGETLWAIDMRACPGLWIDAFPTKQEAIELCERLGFDWSE